MFVALDGCRDVLPGGVCLSVRRCAPSLMAASHSPRIQTNSPRVHAPPPLPRPPHHVQSNSPHFIPHSNSPRAAAGPGGPRHPLPPPMSAAGWTSVAQAPKPKSYVTVVFTFGSVMMSPLATRATSPFVCFCSKDLMYFFSYVNHCHTCSHLSKSGQGSCRGLAPALPRSRH